MAELLLEIGSEEIPARMLAKAVADLKTAVENLLREAGLGFDPLEAHGAPRQLLVYGYRLDPRQEDREETVMGPPVRIAYDAEGQPTRALLGFLKNNPALEREKLLRVEQKKGTVVAGKLMVGGRSTNELLAEALPGILAGMHFPKTMRWGSCRTRFVRPVRNLLALLDGEVIPFSFGGRTSGNLGFGHRLCGGGPFPVSGIDQYLREKEEREIIVTHAGRRRRIESQIQAHLQSIGGKLVEDEALLCEVTDLVEIPYVVLGAFDAGFLNIPKEVLITSLRDHQKSFAVQNEAGELLPFFLSIANMANDAKGLIKKGNEWVLNARLYDAKFFWESDLKKDFEHLREKLGNLMFQVKIGSYRDKTERIVALTAAMAGLLGLDSAARAALAFASLHCKTDLVSEMVFEFPELQGITGGLLLAAKGHPADVHRAVYQHYRPNSMDDELPGDLHGALISVADKLDTLVGCFAIGLIPKGAKDPYALRRATQGIVRILIELELPLSLGDLLDASIQAYQGVVATTSDLAGTLRLFFCDRMRYYLKREGFEYDLVEAVLARDTDRVDQTLKRARAIELQRGKETFRSLTLNLKRINNVVADEADRLPCFDPRLLREEAEIELWNRFNELKPDIERAASERDYNRAMDLMNPLADPVEHYFGTSGVYVNVEDETLRLNRKGMLDQIRLTLGLVADISCLDAK